jgi:hypothetical protein
VTAEAVSSNPTQSIFITLSNYGIKSGFVLRSCPTECLAIEEAEWKPFTNALDKSDRKEFDDMFDIPRLYITACSVILLFSMSETSSNTDVHNPLPLLRAD